ncbi:glycosyltransferase family 25 protein [Gluconacetobacter liquefaciens]|uniref:GR25 family glycosyltransferase involved in LPS biosynthesis n=1 Tax=Gluconacetobacter liquefaciens TaxID=89584 RepID=A0A370G7J2_GLULI|nr:glycosyltransferase family 25 protein [Gluconacetobacter liquefaciens]MBB2185955.1 glycosyl transferase [Gluconacetobacter liquefaciens]RDI39771.1 GR25 family glycosyltransferase involved in LPS biosynthesis [Gluconacetobacter liquefaciens]
MKKFFISLDRTPERTERFLNANSHIEGFIKAPGIDGSLLDIDEMKAKRFVADNCWFTRGAIGSGLTHVALWGSIAKSGIAGHIFEDDAFLCRNFEQESNRVLASLPEDWDIILWGNNSDTTLQFELLPGITNCVAIFDQDSVRKGISTFRAMNVSSLPFRLDQTFGICGYAISPKGAEAMIKRCLPMHTTDITYSSLGNRVITATSIDHLMNMHYREMKAYMCFPPLCLTDNQSENSLNK